MVRLESATADTAMLQFSLAMVRQTTARNNRVAVAHIRELTDRVLHFIAEIPGTAFTSVRQRVARHLLERLTEPSKWNPGH